MTVLALDWNATRVRAVLGAEGTCAVPMPLDPPALELATVIALDHSVPAIGWTALRRSRLAAHELCESFLPYLTEKPGHGPQWHSERIKLDSHAACDLVWRRLQPATTDVRGVVLTVPDYLRPVQASTLRKFGERMRLPMFGSIPTSLAAALAAKLPSPAGRGIGAFLPSPSGNGVGAYPPSPPGRGVGGEGHLWHSSVLVVDVDEHALTLGWVKTLGDRIHLVETRSFPHLGWHHWKERLIDGLSARFVLEHRRDPRDAPLAEQSLFDQLEMLADAAVAHRSIQLGVQGREWFKHLLVQAAEVAQYCRPLAQRAIAEADHILQGWSSAEGSPNVLLTSAASRLPGLMDGLRSLTPVSPSAETRLPQIKATAFDDADFGDSLLLHDEEPMVTVNVLAPEAPACAAHSLASAFRTGALPHGHLETIVPLPHPVAVLSRELLAASQIEDPHAASP